MKTITGLVLLTIALLLSLLPPLKINAQSSSQENLLPTPDATDIQPIKTLSKFTQKLEEKTEIISKQTVYKDDPEIEAGIEKILDEGEDGKKTFTIKFTYYDNNEDNQEVTATKITPAKDKIILRGTKIIWRELSTENGNISYWKKLHVWATHYDSHCPGCDEWTATGLRAGKGVVAVDPKVIKLGTRVYIPGYGLAVAGDTGGAIKGHIIDLGFDDAKTAGWSAKFTDIYLLN